MKKIIILTIFLIITSLFFSQQNDFFMKLSKKELATFNDGITLIRLLYNERDDESVFIENILWVVEKKLFKVTIPISNDQINPVLTRRIFAYWICKIYNNKQGLVNNPNITKYSAFNTCVSLGLISEARGGYDSFTGAELLDTFAYIDNYVKYYNIKPNKGVLEKLEDDYDGVPLWRKKLYQEIEEQRKKEKEELVKARNERKEKFKLKLKTNKIKKEDKEIQIEE